MSYRYINHLTAIEKSTRTKPENIAFKVPSESKSGWRDITYEEFWNDITRLALCWPKLLDVSVERKRKVVGLWIAGKTYADVVHMFSLQRAGYTPRLLRTYIKDVDIIQSQVEEAGARVVIYDTKHAQGWERLPKMGIKVVPLSTHEEIVELGVISFSTSDLSGLPPLDGDGDGDDILFITQSSGSTSGCPSVVPLTRRRMDASAQKCQIDEQRTPVVVRNAPFYTTAQMGGALRTFLYADCVVLPSEYNWEANELESLITQCGVTNLVISPALIEDILEKAKTSNLLAKKLRTLKDVTFIGAPLGTRAFESAKEMGINIACEYGLTEVGLIMGSEPTVLSGPPLLTFYRKFDYEFIPIKDGNGGNTNLHELVILPTSPDCPVLTLRDPIDGKFHTKDLFELVEGGYIFRGRRTDMILLENTTLLCNAKYIEDQILYLCHDLISSLVVVGQGRPSLALLVEPKLEAEAKSTRTGIFRDILLSRLESLHSSKTMKFSHERIKPEHIIILPKGSIPVAPGKAVVIRPKSESLFKEMLDRVYTNDRSDKKRCLIDG